MSDNNFSTDIVRRVWDENAGAYFEIGPFLDDPSLVELRTVGEKNTGWFGPINISMHPAFARQVGEALIAAAKDIQ